MYKIYIDNFGFQNKGDQLMIQSVLEQVRSRYPEAQVLLRKTAFLEDPIYCIKNHIYPLKPKNTWSKYSKLYYWLVKLLLGERWLTTPNQVDLILDCRGYHIADAWIKDDSYCQFLEDYYSRFNKKNRKLVMLPQSFGPFAKEQSRKAMQIVYEQAEMIYAREQQSYDYLRELFPDSPKLRIAPDFTCLCRPSEKLSVQLPPKGYVIVIPNARMVDKTDNSVSSGYLGFLQTIVSFLTQSGEKVCFLNHEGEGDEKLMKEVNKHLEHPIPIYTGWRGAEAKALIRDAKLLITARYHGAVSGLTQGVPTLCTSWSHKYAELLKEFGCERNVLAVDQMEEAKRIIKDSLDNPKKYTPEMKYIEEVEKKTKEMWDGVFEIQKEI